MQGDLSLDGVSVCVLLKCVCVCVKTASRFEHVVVVVVVTSPFQPLTRAFPSCNDAGHFVGRASRTRVATQLRLPRRLDPFDYKKLYYFMCIVGCLCLYYVWVCLYYVFVGVSIVYLRQCCSTTIYTLSLNHISCLQCFQDQALLVDGHPITFCGFLLIWFGWSWQLLRPRLNSATQYSTVVNEQTSPE